MQLVPSPPPQLGMSTNIQTHIDLASKQFRFLNLKPVIGTRTEIPNWMYEFFKVPAFQSVTPNFAYVHGRGNE